MTQDTSTEAANFRTDAEAMRLIAEDIQRYVPWGRGEGNIRALAAERDTLAKRVEEVVEKYSRQADKYHERVDEIIDLRKQLAEARNAALEEAADRTLPDNPDCKCDICVALVHRAKAIRALKSEPAPRQKSKAVPSTAPVEVCGICDIAGCHHTRELNEKMPNEIAAWQTFPDGCVTGSWSANQHHQDAVAYVRKEPAPGHLDDECQRCGSVGGFGCYECTPAPRQSVQEAAKVLLREENGMSDELNSAGWEFIEAWRDIVQEPLSPMAFNHCKPILRRVFNHYLRALAQET